MKFEPRVTTQATIVCDRSCACPFALVLHDSHPSCSHFNVLEPEGECCKAPKPHNLPETSTINLIDKCHDTPFPASGKVNLPKPKKRKRKCQAEVKKERKCCSSGGKKQAVDRKQKAPDFGTMKLKELKTYVTERGVPVSAYKKQQLIHLATSLHEMNADVDPDYKNDSIEEVLKDRLTLPSGRIVPNPLQMKNVSNDFSNLPNFGLMDVFNHLIMSETEYDKDMLASWRSFEEYTLCQNGHVRSMQNQIVFDENDDKYHVITAKVIPTQRDKTPEGELMYSLWFILKPNGSVYSAFCTCKGGADQGCRHLGAALFELDDFLSKERPSVTSLPAYWNPKPMPDTTPLPFMEMKMASSTGQNTKKVVTNYDESWIDSFDPRPPKERKDQPDDKQKEFARRLRDIDKHSGILDYLPGSETHTVRENQTSSSSESDAEVDLSHMTIKARAKEFARDNEINESNIDEMSQRFVESLKVTQKDIDLVNRATIGQHKNDNWHEMRHLLVTGKKIKNLYTRQKTTERNPQEDVTKTVQNFVSPPTHMKTYPVAIQYGINKEQDAREAYIKIMRKHANLSMEEPGLVLSGEHGWLGASPDGIRKCSCCPYTLLEIKCPFKGADIDPKEAFLLDTIGGNIDKDGNYFLKTTHIHYFQIQTGMAVCGLKKCDFVVFTSKGIYVINIDFDEAFWNSTVNTVKTFYTKNIIRTLLLSEINLQCMHKTHY